MAEILLIEDEFVLLRLYTKALQAKGHRVIASLALQSALDVVDRRSLDIIITDIQVGVVKQDYLLEQLARIQKKNDIPVLVISAAMDTYQSSCELLGLHHTLAKPFSNKDLVGTVETILADREKGHSGAVGS